MYFYKIEISLLKYFKRNAPRKVEGEPHKIGEVVVVVVVVVELCEERDKYHFNLP